MDETLKRFIEESIKAKKFEYKYAGLWHYKYCNAAFSPEYGLKRKRHPTIFTATSRSKIFWRVILVATQCHTNIEKGIRMTVRELFYALNHLESYFARRNDGYNFLLEAIQILVCKLDTSRGELNIVSGQRHDIVGDVSFKDLEGNTVSAQTYPKAISLDEVHEIKSEAQVLVICESSTAFRRLMSENFMDSMPVKTILLASHGMPTVAFSKLCHKLAKYVIPRAQVYCVFDASPATLLFYRNLKYGTLSRLYSKELYPILRMKWLGMSASDLVSYPELVKTPTTPHHISICKKMLQSGFFDDHMEKEARIFLRESCCMEFERIRSPSVFITEKILEVSCTKNAE